GQETARARPQGVPHGRDRPALRRRASPLAVAAREERSRARHRNTDGAGELRAIGGARSRVSGSVPAARPALLPAEGAGPGPRRLREVPRPQTGRGRCQTSEGVPRGARAVASTGRPRRRPPFTLALARPAALPTRPTRAVIGRLPW